MTTDVHFTPDTDSVQVVPDHAGADAEKRLSPGEVLTISVLVFSTFVAFLSEMVVGVALPQIMDDLDITAMAYPSVDTQRCSSNCSLRTRSPGS